MMKPQLKPKAKVGDLFICSVSKSNFYTQGKTYEVVSKNEVLGFIGNDGLFDPLGVTNSQFIPKPVGVDKGE